MAATTEHNVKSYDLVVIGGGSGGMGFGRRAASHGKKVAVVEAARMGGTCVNVGCVPKKIMWNAANIAHTIHLAKDFGFSPGQSQFRWAEYKAKRDAHVRMLNGVYVRNLDKDGLDLHRGFASFCDEKTVEVKASDGSSTFLTAEHFCIAVGGEPIMLDIPGKEHMISSDGFFELEALPKRVLVLGAGYIAVELAGVLACLGSEVTLACRKQGVLRTLQKEIFEQLNAQLAKSVNLRSWTECSAVERGGDGKLAATVVTTDAEGAGEKVSSKIEGLDVVLCAVGRRAVASRIGCDKAGVKLDPQGGIIVDRLCRTSNKNVFALGDVIRKVDLTPVAIQCGRRLADSLYGGVRTVMNYDMIPTVIFSHPPTAYCGLTDVQAKAAYPGKTVRTYRAVFRNMFFAPVAEERKEKTAMAIVCVGEEEKVAGIHIFGLGADEMMQGFGVAMKMGCTKFDLDQTTAIHPTASEELVTMRWGNMNKDDKEAWEAEEGGKAEESGAAKGAAAAAAAAAL